MGIFNEFNKKEKPVFTGLRFGFGSGGGGAGGGPLYQFFCIWVNMNILIHLWNHRWFFCSGDKDENIRLSIGGGGGGTYGGGGFGGAGFYYGWWCK